MQDRLKKVNSAIDYPGLLGDDDARVPVIDNAIDDLLLGTNVYHSKAQRSQRDVYEKVRFALNRPMSWFLIRAWRGASAYSLPILWAGTGCVFGLGIAIFHNQLTPTVNLPSKKEMNAVFSLHDLNELLIASHPQIRTKS
jgi:hypothetical protein